MLHKKKSEEYLKLEANFFITKMLVEIPKMKFTIKNFIPVLNFEYKIGSKNVNKLKSEKAIISPVRNNFYMIIDSTKFLFKYFKSFKKLVNISLNKIKLIYFNIDITFGHENPAVTGVLVGHMWSIIFQSLGLLSFYFDIKGADINARVRPDFFEYKPIQMEINCIFHIRVGHIIIASFLIAWYLLLFKIRSKWSKKQYI